ncbi:HlyD family type I secretion periplasmic adaptor subunit [Alsobacter sp. SYSU BS001988]
MGASLITAADGAVPQRPSREAHRSMRTHLLAAVGLSVVLVVGLGGWAATTSFSGAVIAPGQLVVATDVKKVQHPTGGIVGELRVHDGDAVRAGDVLIRLDETQTRANLDIVLKAIDELSARRARFEAERDGAQDIAFPPEMVARASANPVVGQLIAGETRQFLNRRASRNGQKAQLRERVAQLDLEIAGLKEQTASKTKEIALIQDELKGVRELWQRNLVQISRVTALERDAARLEGDRGRLVASTAQTKGKISETELQILQIDQDLRSEVTKELADIRARWSEMVEKKVAAEDMLKRTELRAPVDGVVHQMTVHTIGGLVTSTEPAMLIVPHGDDLVVEVKLQPQDIDHVHLDQPAHLRFPAFNQRTTPEIAGEVSRISADVTTDPRTGLSYYTARIRVSEEEKSRLGGVKLVPGMPVEAFLQTGDRTVISYLTKPLTDQLAKAWREH